MCQWVLTHDGHILACQRLQASGLSSSSLATATKLGASTSWSLVAPSSWCTNHHGALLPNMAPAPTLVALWTSSTSLLPSTSTSSSWLHLLLLRLLWSWLLLLLPGCTIGASSASTLALSATLPLWLTVCRRSPHVRSGEKLQV